jgi:hypothetical protein
VKDAYLAGVAKPWPCACTNSVLFQSARTFAKSPFNCELKSLYNVLIPFLFTRKSYLGVSALPVAGAAFGAHYDQISWPTQHLEHVMIKFRGRHSTWST